MNFSSPLCADVVDGSAVSQSRGEIRFEPMVMLFEVQHARKEREGGPCARSKCLVCKF